jgi:signal transduction histidine kinase
MRKHLLFMVSTLVAVIVSAQDHYIDSLNTIIKMQKDDTSKVRTLNLLSLAHLYKREFAAAYQPANRSLQLANKIGDYDGKGRAQQLIGVFYEMQGNYKDARKYYDSALFLFTKSTNKNLAADVYESIASSYRGEQNFPEALNYTYKALKVYEETENKTGIAGIYLVLGSNSLHSGEYDAAIRNLRKALEVFEALKEKSVIGLIYEMIAAAEYSLGRHTEALRNDSIALKLYTEVGEVFNKGALYTNKGNIYQKQGDELLNDGSGELANNKYQKALEEYRNAAQIYKELHVEQSLHNTNVELGFLFIKLHDPAAAKYHLNQVFQYLSSLPPDEKKNLNYLFENLYLAQSKLDSANGNTDSAYMHYKMYVAYKDSSLTLEKAKRIEQITLQHDFDKKESQAKIEQERKDNASRRMRNQLFTGIGAVLLLSGFLFWNNRQKEKSKVKIEKAYTALKATQAQLIQREKMASLGELTAGIAHEIQNPLNFVTNFSETNIELVDELQSELKALNYDVAVHISNDIKENERLISHHGKRADAIVKSMMEHSRGSKNGQEHVEVKAIIEECLRLSYHAFRAKDKSFHAKVENLSDGNADTASAPHEVGRVLLNLLNNAFYSVSERKKAEGVAFEPRVSVSVKKADRKLEITVKDNGRGIAPEIQKKIFQPFFTTKPTGQGTGLGLSLSYDIVIAHGGELRVGSTSEGATFLIELPLQNT